VASTNSHVSSLLAGFTLLLLSFLLCSSAAVAQIAAASPAEAVDPVKISLQLKWLHQFQFAGYYAAIAKGYYRDAGLEVNLIEPAEDTDAVREVLEGRADFGVTGPDLLLSSAKGDPVVALAVIFQHSPMVLLARADSGISSLHDLVGRRVMFSKSSAELMAYFEAERLPIEQLDLVPHTYSPDALIKGEVDAFSAYIGNEPFLLNEAGVKYLVFNPRAGGIDFYGDLLFSTQSQIDASPEKVRAFVAASLRGWQYAMKNPDEIIDLILSKYSQRHSREHLKYEAELMQQMLIPEVVEIGYMNPGRWRAIADTFISQGMIPAGFKLDGFIYDRDPKPDFRKIFFVAGVIILLVVVLFIASSFYFRHIRHLHQEVVIRLQAEKRYNDLLVRYEYLLENAPFPIIISGMTTRKLLYQNPAAAALFGIKAEDESKVLVSDFYAIPDQRQAILEMIESQGSVRDYEVVLKKTDGQEIWTSITAAKVTFDDQTALFSSVLDVTERVRARAELKELSDRLQLITDNMLDVVWLIDVQTSRFLYVSPSVYQLCGYKPEEMMAQLADNLLSPESREKVAFLAREAQQKIADGETLSEGRLVRIDLLHRDGSTVHIEEVSRYIISADGAVRHIGVSRDISERIRAESEKVRLEGKLQQLKKAESLSRLAGAVAHHFNNRLHGVLGYLEFSMEDVKKGIFPVENLEAATDAARQAAEIGALMLTYLGESMISTDSIDLRELCKSTFADIQKKSPENLEFEHVSSEVPLPVRANTGQLRQVLMNLYANAVEAIGARNGVIKTELRIAGKDEIDSVNRYPVDWEPDEALYGSFKITDNGDGIASADLEQIFDPFFTTRFTGRGLGLAVALGVIRNHGGGMAVISEPGKGSSFSFYLPLH